MFDLYRIGVNTCMSFAQLDLVLKSEEGGDLSDFITNGEWYLIGKHSKKLKLHKFRLNSFTVSDFCLKSRNAREEEYHCLPVLS